MAPISHFVATDAPIFHFWLEFLTFGHFSSKFLTFGSNFSLFATFSAKFSLFQPAPLPRRPAHSHAFRPFSCRRPAPIMPALPMPFQWHGYYRVIGMFWRAGACWQVTVWHAGVRKVRNSDWKVRNSCNCAPLVRNSRQKWEIQSEKWEICTFVQKKWEIWAISEKFARLCRKNEKFEP